jgi:hypothetical protein
VNGAAAENSEQLVLSTAIHHLLSLFFTLPFNPFAISSSSASLQTSWYGF